MRYAILIIYTFFSISTYGQYGRNSQFLVGYQDLPQDTMYDFINMSYLQFKDTGLYSSEPFFIPYGTVNTQFYTYCDTSGKPLLQWQGCGVLESDSFSIIENGFFPHSYIQGVCKLNLTDPDSMILDRQVVPYGNYILSFDNNDDDLYLIYLRAKDFDNITLKGAHIIKNQEGRYHVNQSDINVSADIHYSFGSAQVIRHANGHDWWVIFGDSEIRQNFYAVLLDKEGFHPPIKTFIEEWFPANVGDFFAVSPDGSLVGVTAINSNFILLNFDRCFGTFKYKTKGPVEHLNPSPAIEEFYHYIEFSPSGRYLYVNTDYRIFQYDLQSTNFLGSKKIVATYDTTGLSYIEKFGFISNPIRAPNGRIYYWSLNSIPLLHKIEYPDRPAAEVGFVQGHVKLPIYISWWSQSFVNYDLGPLPPGSCELSTEHHNGDISKIAYYPNPTRDRLYLSRPQNTSIATCELMTMSGQVALRVRDPDDLTDAIDLSPLPPGIYLLKINGQVIGKVVKVE